MIDIGKQEPWDRIKHLLETEQVEAVGQFLTSLPPGETARALSRLGDAEHVRLLELLGPETAAELLEGLSDAQATDIIEELPPDQAAAIVDQFRSDQQADVLGELNATDAEAILDQMAPEEAADARLLLQYEPDTAGGLMVMEYLAYPDHLTVADVVRDLRDSADRYADYAIQYVYVTDAAQVLVGVLRLRDLLLARGSGPIRQHMVADPRSIAATATIAELTRLLDQHRFVGIPVTDDAGRLIGVITRGVVEAARGEVATEDFLKVSGLVGVEEFRSMPILQRSFRRLSWLSINIVLNIIAASVIAFYQDTLTAVIALAVFLPIISDMSGCSGNQAVAVSVRELALGLIKPYEFRRVLLKESAVGLINGIALGIILGGVAIAWRGNVYLGLVVGAAMTLNTINAVALGGLIPLGLKALNLDPALASGPILTTVTDMVGFFLVLSMATMMLPQLVG